MTLLALRRWRSVFDAHSGNDIRIFSDGYDTYEQLLVPEGPIEKMTVTLTPKPAVYYVRLQPEDAKLACDEPAIKKTGVGSWTLTIPSPIADHRVVVNGHVLGRYHEDTDTCRRPVHPK